MKKILAVLLALIMVLGVTSAFADEMKKPLKVGVTIYQFNDNFMTLYRTELQKYLEETYGAQVTVVDGKNDQTEQTNQINSFIADGVDVLIINMVQATSSAAVTELLRRYLGDQKPREIALALGITSRQVQNRLYRARSRLRAQLNMDEL